MDKHYFIDDYLQGKHPIEGKKWELPTEDELDRDEALYDALLTERKKASLQPPSNFPLKGEASHPVKGNAKSWGRSVALRLFAAAAVLVAVLALFTWKSHTSAPLPPTLEKTAVSAVPKDTAQTPEKHNVSKLPTQHVAMTNATRRDDQRHTSRLQVPRVAQRTPTNQNTLNTPITLNTQEPSTSEPKLLNAADSLYYYLTKLEDQMGDCRDSTCLAELTGLMRADERIKDLVNKIIHKQVETAYQEEYLVDTTTRYIPL